MAPGRALSKAAETVSRGRMGPSPTCTQDMFPDFCRVSLFSEGKCCDGETRARRSCLIHHKRLRNIGLYCDACLLLQGRSPLPSYVFLPTTSHKLLPKPGLEGAGAGTHKVHSPGRSCQGLSGYSTRPEAGHTQCYAMCPRIRVKPGQPLQKLEDLAVGNLLRGIWPWALLSQPYLLLQNPPHP